MGCKRIVILGSTGSIGINTLKVVQRFPDRFKIIGLTAYNNLALLERQIKQFSPRYVAVSTKGIQRFKRHAAGRNVKILNAESDLSELVTLEGVDIVVIAMPGSAALGPFLSALQAGKTVAPANKEALVAAGDILMREAARHKATIIPVDSEQSAIFQCLNSQPHNKPRKVYLTASGGALLKIPRSQFDRLSVKQILQHPRWKMGRKITVDSATLMNKGFEIIEAGHLFRLPVDTIEVVVHPEAVVHSMVEFNDGTIIAQLGITDMRLPIQYALTYPERWGSGLKKMDFFALKQLTFQKPDLDRFPALGLALHAARRGGTLPSVLNAADEEAVDAFLSGRIAFSDIYRVIEKVVLRHNPVKEPTLQCILDADREARLEARKIIDNALTTSHGKHSQ